MILHVSMLTQWVDSCNILRMSHAYPEPIDTPRLDAQFRKAADSAEWLDCKYQYTPAEIRAINGHYGWEAFRIKPQQEG